MIAALASQARAGEIYNIWQGREMPGAVSEKPEDKTPRTIKYCNTPTLEIHPSKTGKSNGFVIVCPGGAYQCLCRTYEGDDIAEALAERGISAGVLLYRVPNNKSGALMDAHRAIRFVRANAAKLGVDSNKVAIMGFSAGGNLSARTSAPATYAPADGTDKQPEVPNAIGLIYPAYIDAFHEDGKHLKKNPETDYSKRYALATNIKISADMPPVFIVSSQEDICVDASIAQYLAMKREGARATLLLFDKGKHGFGIRDKKNLNCEWIDLYAKWLKLEGF